MALVRVVLLGIIQGLTELLPVSSSAHVVVAEKLMGLDASAPDMTLLLVMLHTGTMLAVLVYFWKSWREHYFANVRAFIQVAVMVAVASVITVLIGLALQFVIEKVFLKGTEEADIESLFSQLPLIAVALLAAGLLILVAGGKDQRQNPRACEVNVRSASWIGAVQGLFIASPW